MPGSRKVRLSEHEPHLLLADHLEREAPVLVFRVDDLEATLSSLQGAGVEVGARFGIPQGPCAELRAPAGQRLAVYEVTRPGTDARLAGRHDFGPGAQGG